MSAISLKEGPFDHIVIRVYRGHAKEPENLPLTSSCPLYSGKKINAIFINWKNEVALS